MSKLLLIIDSDDLNNDCLNCPVKYAYVGGVGCLIAHEDIETEFIPDWCPLRPLPDKATPENSDMGISWNLGWNACLDVITGEDKE